MSRLLVHNLSIPYAYQPDCLYAFDKNAIYFAEPGDSIMVRTSPPDAELLAYLTEQKIVAAPLVFFISKIPSGPFSVFEDEDCIIEMRSHLNSDSEIDVFMPTLWEERLAQKLEIKYPYASAQYESQVHKSLFRKTARSLGLPIAKGYEDCATAIDILLAAITLLLHGAQEIIIKQDDGVAGIGSKRLDVWQILRAIFTPSLLLPSAAVTPSAGSKYIVEVWQPDVVASPSIQCHINPEGVISIVSVHNQIIRANGMSYMGCNSEHWLDADVVQKLEKYAWIYCERLVLSGFSGHLAFNAVLQADGNLVFTEVNPRRVISSYPFQILTRLGYERDTMPPYTAIEIERSEWKNISPSVLLEKLNSVLYTAERKEGMIPFDLKLLSSGRVMMLIIAPTRVKVEEYIEYAKLV